MTDGRKGLDDVLTTLEGQRDELALQMHLAKAEAKEEWERLQKKLAALTARVRPVGKVVGETAGEVGSAIELAAEEIKKGFDRVRSLLA
jgi:hypothetical protein